MHLNCFDPFDVSMTEKEIQEANNKRLLRILEKRVNELTSQSEAINVDIVRTSRLIDEQMDYLNSRRDMYYQAKEDILLLEEEIRKRSVQFEDKED